MTYPNNNSKDAGEKVLTFWSSINIIELSEFRKWGEKMSPRTGRPKSESPRTNQISTRMTDEELKRLDDYCAKHEKERASTVRAAVIEFLDRHEKK